MRWLALLSIFLFAACSSNEAARENTTDSNSIIRIADIDARGLDPQIVSDLASIRIAADQFEGLTRFNVEGNAEAGLARDWKVSADGRVWTFRLREALAFSDGTPIRADVFKKAIARIRAETSASPHVSLFSIIHRLPQPTLPATSGPIGASSHGGAALPFDRTGG